MYWNINQILPYQRNWNFINGPREIGKTYTTLKWLIKQAVTKHRKFVYITRTMDQKKNGALSYATQKVLDNEFPELHTKCDTLSLFMTTENDKGKVTASEELARCIAITEYVKVKTMSFPDFYYLIFDEYMLEEDSPQRYVKGWKEPDFLLSLYHTIDRGEDRLKCFLLGNNTSFYNPYHLHPAFDIPLPQPGKIWTSQNVLFQWAMPSQELAEKLGQNKITQQIQGTEYGKYAVEGLYVEDSALFIGGLSKNAMYQFTMHYQDSDFGVYSDPKTLTVTISDKIDSSCKYVYCVDYNDQTENTALVSKPQFHMQWIGYHFKHGNVFYENMKIKSKAMEWIRKIL